MPGFRANGFDLVSYHDLDGKPAFKLALQVVEGRWYLYGSRFWHPGIVIMDVTDPSSPELVGEISEPADPNVASWQVQVRDGLLIQGLQHRPAVWGGNPSMATEEGIYVWDVRDPVHPELLSKWRTGAGGTHRNLYAGGRYIHATSSARGYEGYLYSIIDVDDISRPREVGRWFFPDQFTFGGARPVRRLSHHGPAYPVGDRAYLAYGAAGLVVLDISDVAAPRLVSQLEFGPAFSSRIALHTVIPLPDRGLAVVNTEAIAEESREPLNFAGIVDISNEAEMRLMSLFPLPVPEDGAPYSNFNTRGGRFGPHNQHHHQGDPNLFHSDELVYLTWFNGGLRVYDISDPYVPREVAWFLPDDPVDRRGPLPRGALVTQSEDVLVDSRGYAYLTDKNHGLHVVRFRG